MIEAFFRSCAYLIRSANVRDEVLKMTQEVVLWFYLYGYVGMIGMIRYNQFVIRTESSESLKEILENGFTAFAVWLHPENVAKVLACCKAIPWRSRVMAGTKSLVESGFIEYRYGRPAYSLKNFERAKC